MMKVDLKARVSVIEDIAVSDLCGRHLVGSDQDQRSDAADPYNDDGEFRSSKVSYRGRPDQRRNYHPPPVSGRCHFVSNEIIRLAGKTAVSECYCSVSCMLEGERYVRACRYDQAPVEKRTSGRLRACASGPSSSPRLKKVGAGGGCSRPWRADREAVIAA